ncbi:hypothetical protein AAHE18_20G150200 [Arachis hypogaea]
MISNLFPTFWPFRLMSLTALVFHSAATPRYKLINCPIGMIGYQSQDSDLFVDSVSTLLLAPSDLPEKKCSNYG